jgi:coenzyme F420 hydrogenase subunit beta
MGCGACMPICPFGAVNIVKDNKNGTYKPVISEKCVQCGLCVEACFGIGVNLKLSLGVFNKESEDPVLGIYSNCYGGYACDNEIRYSSASGGIVSALLLFALEEKMVDGVLVTKMDERKPLEPKPFIAKTKSEVVSAARSKYCPVPVDMALKAIMQEDGHYAVVGLPCHIYGIRKAESIYPDLTSKILFHIGIFCGGMPNFLATEYLLRRLKLRREEIMRIEYRGEGWPGKMLIELKGIGDNQRDKLLLPYPEYWDGFSSLFLPYRCTLCADGFNKFADVSCGDAWLPEYRGDNLGTSIIITRNEIGEQLISGAYEKGRIQIKNIDCARVKQAQKSMIRFKTQNLGTRFQLLRTLRKPIPVYNNINVKMPQPTVANYMRCGLFYLFWFIASKRSMWNLLDIYHALRHSRLKLGAKKA